MTAAESDRNCAPSADVFLNTLDWLLPALRHDIRGRFNAALLNLEVAGRAIDRGDPARSKAALERARDENRGLSNELPLLLAWFSRAEETDRRTCNQWRREIERLLKPTFERNSIELSSFTLEERCRDSLLDAQQARVLMVSIVWLAKALTDQDLDQARLSVDGRVDGELLRFSIATDPEQDESLLDTVISQIGMQVSLSRCGNGLQFEIANPPGKEPTITSPSNPEEDLP